MPVTKDTRPEYQIEKQINMVMMMTMLLMRVNRKTNERILVPSYLIRSGELFYVCTEYVA
jgi:hypothetical protein